MLACCRRVKLRPPKPLTFFVSRLFFGIVFAFAASRGRSAQPTQGSTQWARWITARADHAAFIRICCNTGGKKSHRLPDVLSVSRFNMSHLNSYLHGVGLQCWLGCFAQRCQRKGRWCCITVAVKILLSRFEKGVTSSFSEGGNKTLSEMDKILTSDC